MSDTSYTNVKYIVSNPSKTGPNLSMNTQDTQNGYIGVNPVQPNLPGGYDTNWRETQWNAGETFDPLKGRDNVVWDNKNGYSIGNWQQGSSTSTAGSSQYAVFQDPQNGNYIYKMSVQGGNLNNQQIATAKNFGTAYSFDRPITLTTDIAVSNIKGSTGFIEGGINFTLQFDNGTTQYGLFLQVPTFDGRGSPVGYVSMSDKTKIIYNITGQSTSYIEVNDPSTSGVTYKATIDVNQALKYAIDAIAIAHPTDAAAIKDLSHWYLTGVYYGIESNGTGLATDKSGTLTVANPQLTYDNSGSLNYSDLSSSGRSLSLTPETTGGALSNVNIPGKQVNIIVENVGTDALGAIINDYAKSIAQYASANTLQASVLASGDNDGTGTVSAPAEGIITDAGSYKLYGNYAYLFVGTMSGTSPTGRVTIDGTANTAQYVRLISDSAYGIDAKFGNVGGQIAARAGDNNIDVSGSRQNWDIVTGDGNNTISGGAGTNMIKGDKGRSVFNLGGSNNYIRSEGQDTINGVQGAIDTVSLIGGGATATLYTNAAVVDLSTNNTIRVADNSTVLGGTASRIMVTSGDTTVVGAVRDTISAAGNLTVTHGAGLNLSVAGNLTFIAGTGQSTVSSGGGTIWGAQGLNLTLSSKFGSLFTANQPHAIGDQYVDASRSNASMSFWTGAGNQTIVGGTGSDSFYFGTAFEGVNTSHVAATVTGGTGAGDKFGMLVNHTAGDFYITDFRAANNQFFLYFYRPANATEAAQNLLNTATISGGNTSVLVDGNARVTFLGVTDLNLTDFSIS